MNIKPRKTAPAAKSSYDDVLSFRVWCYDDGFQVWNCIVAFRFLRECLDYIASLQDAGIDCVFQSPADTRLVKHDEQRVVWKPAEELATV